MTCPRCGYDVAPGSAACPRCGQTFIQGKYCGYCGALIDAAAAVCPQCGRALLLQGQPPAQQPPTGPAFQPGVPPAKKGGFRWWHVLIGLMLVAIGIGIGLALAFSGLVTFKTTTYTTTVYNEREDVEASFEESLPRSELAPTPEPTLAPAPDGALTEADLPAVFADPEAYRRSKEKLDITGTVQGSPTVQTHSVLFRLSAPGVEEGQALHISFGKDIGLKEGDQVRVIGKVTSSTIDEEGTVIVTLLAERVEVTIG